MIDMNKILTVIVIFFCVGVAIAPSINTSVVKASQDDDLVEVTTQACGIKGYGNTTVKLTREQYQNLEEYLIEFRARLNQTSTRAEAIPIFKEAVVELDRYRLLPKGMSVERTQRFVTKSYDKQVKIVDSLNRDPDANYFCLVSGLTDGTFSIGPLTDLAIRCSVYAVEHNLYFLMNVILFPVFLLSLFGGMFTYLLPFGLLSVLTFGSVGPEISGNRHYPSSGWVYSNGLNGEKKYESSELWGTVRNESTFFRIIIRTISRCIRFYRTQTTSVV